MAVGFEGANVGGGDFFKIFDVIFGWEIEFVENLAICEIIDDVRIGPGGDVDTVGDGFEFYFFASDVVVVGDAGVELADAGAELGDFDSNGGKADSSLVKFITEPLFDGWRLQVGKNKAFKLLVREFGFGGLDESMVGVKGMLSGVNDGFVEVHAVAGELVKAGKGGKEGGNFV